MIIYGNPPVTLMPMNKNNNLLNNSCNSSVSSFVSPPSSNSSSPAPNFTPNCSFKLDEQNSNNCSFKIGDKTSPNLSFPLGEMVLKHLKKEQQLMDTNPLHPILLSTIPKCAGCTEPILDRFILKVLERTWHSHCLKCTDCGSQLTDKCFYRNQLVYCKEDFFRRFGTKCAGCEQGIPPTQVVRRAQENVYHLHCFSCIICQRQLNTGDEFYLMEDNKLVCKSDYEQAKQRDGDGTNKRPRTTISARQLERLKQAYKDSSKPARHVREQLAQSLGLDMRVVQVWFQNRRAKEKRLKKDAGRTRWGQYFRSMKGGGRDKRRDDDKTDSELDIDSHDDMILDMPDGYRTPGPQMNDMEPGQTTMSPHLVPPGHPSGAPHIPYLHGAGTPPYLGGGTGGHSPGGPQGIPPPHPMIASFPAYTDALPAYQAALAAAAGGILPPSLGNGGGPASDLSSNGSNPGYPDFPPSPDSWLGDMQPDQPPQQTPSHQY